VTVTRGVPATGTGQRGHHVRIRGVVKRYGAVTALAGVDLDIEPGRFVVLLGPSGSGKSTLVRGLAGIERLDGGSVHFDETPMSAGRRHVPPDRRDLAMVFQDYALWPHLTVLGNVGYALRRRRLGSAEAGRQVREALGRVGLDDLAERYPHELSGGQQQRVGLARAIVARPALLLFDEPLSNLDADLRERLRVEIATTTRDTGSTAVYITHDQSEAFALADEIGILNDGRLEQVGEPEEIYHRPASIFVARFTGMSGQLTGLAAGRRGEYLLVRAGGSSSAVGWGPSATATPSRSSSAPPPPASSRSAPRSPRRRPAACRAPSSTSRTAAVGTTTSSTAVRARSPRSSTPGPGFAGPAVPCGWTPRGAARSAGLTVDVDS